MPLWNPFKNRRPGAGKAAAAPPGPLSQKGASSSKVQEALDTLRQNPTISDADLASALQLSKRAASSPIKQARRLHAEEQAASVPLPGTTPPPMVNLDDINLVNYSPDELMNHVHDTMTTVDFGMANTAKFTHGIASAWSVAGPAMLAAGTAGEVFTVIWMHTRSQEQNIGTAIVVWIAVLAMEISFAVTTYLAANIRHRIARKVNGATTEDKANLRRHKSLWYVLAVGIAASQGVFLMTSLVGASTSEMGLLMLFAVMRPLATMASDYGTAFVHEAKPTTDEEALRIQEERGRLTSKLLHQKTTEITIINDGTIALQKAHTFAEIEQDTLKTELKVKKLENQNRIDLMERQARQVEMITNLSGRIIQAIVDPDVNREVKQRMFGQLMGMSEADNELRKLNPDQTHDEEDY